MSDAFPGTRVVAGQLMRGYAQAAARFREAVREREPDPSYFALFEALNWAVAIDDYVRGVWTPNGESLGWKWRAFLDGDRLAELMNGTRYARNLVHHHWGDALRNEEGARFPMRFPVVFHSWVWRRAEELPQPTGADQTVAAQRAAYDARLAGRRAEDTFIAVGAAFDRVRLFLDPPRPVNRRG